MTTEMHTESASTGIARHLAHEHARLDRVLAETCGRVRDGELDRARHLFREFSSRLAAHVALEEEILFPLYEARAWRAARATAVMRHEHGGMADTVAAMSDALARDDGAAFEEGQLRLAAIQPAHHLKEEQVLYAAIDGVLTDAERSELIGRLTARASSPG